MSQAPGYSDHMNAMFVVINYIFAITNQIFFCDKFNNKVIIKSSIFGNCIIVTQGIFQSFRSKFWSQDFYELSEKHKNEGGLVDRYIKRVKLMTSRIYLY